MFVDRQKAYHILLVLYRVRCFEAGNLKGHMPFMSLKTKPNRIKQLAT